MRKRKAGMGAAQRKKVELKTDSRRLSSGNSPSSELSPPVQKFGLKLDRRQKSLLDTLLFVTKVLLLSVPLYFVILFNVSLYPLQILDASASSGILRSVGYPVEQEGAVISVGSEDPFTFFLSEDCTAWKSFLFLFALVLAVPGIALRKRLAGLGLGIPILWLGNQARIVGVVLTERASDVQFAMLTHDYFWRIFLVFLVIGVWLAWMRWPLRETGKVKPARRRSPPRLLTKKTKK